MKATIVLPVTRNEVSVFSTSGDIVFRACEYYASQQVIPETLFPMEPSMHADTLEPAPIPIPILQLQNQPRKSRNPVPLAIA